MKRILKSNDEHSDNASIIIFTWSLWEFYVVFIFLFSIFLTKGHNNCWLYDSTVYFQYLIVF